jgi:hypothetical protein
VKHTALRSYPGAVGATEWFKHLRARVDAPGGVEGARERSPCPLADRKHQVVATIRRSRWAAGTEESGKPARVVICSSGFSTLYLRGEYD